MSETKTLVHACLMIIAWLYLVPNGIIMARYYKNLLPSIKFLKVAFWFNAHRLFMFLTLIISITAFFLVLADNDWEWIESDDKLEFAHSIFGIIVICLSVIQIFIGLIRPDKDASLRKLFNLFHRSAGLTCLLFAVITCYLATCFEELGLGSVGWGLMLGWSLSLITFIILIEIMEFCFRKKKNYIESSKENLKEEPNKNMKLERIKNCFLVVYLIVSLAFVIALIVEIATAPKGNKNETEIDDSESGEMRFN